MGNSYFTITVEPLPHKLLTYGNGSRKGMNGFLMVGKLSVAGRVAGIVVTAARHWDGRIGPVPAAAGRQGRISGWSFRTGRR